MSHGPGDIHLVDLHRGGQLCIAGDDDEMEITIVDANGDGGTVKVNMTAAEQIQTAILSRLLHVEARRRGR